MSNSFNERLDEIIRKLCHDFENRKVDSLQAQVDAKADITSLIKELVAEAKQEKLKESDYVLNMGIVPGNPPSNTTRTNLYRKGYNDSLDEFEQNLLKVLGYEDEK